MTLSWNKIRPEFLNRIEYKLIFNMLDEKVNKEIIVKQLSEIEERMKNQKLTLSYEEKFGYLFIGCRN